MELYDSIIHILNHNTLTSCYSLNYLALFLPLAILGFVITPDKWKRWTLLAESYLFFIVISGKMVVCLLGSTISVYLIGLWLDSIGKSCKAEVKAAEKEDRKAIKQRYAWYKNFVVFMAVAANIGLLLYLKYGLFISSNLNRVMYICGLPFHIYVNEYVIPIGISFYTLAALSYVLDISRGVQEADWNLGRVALFISFFPQIVEGPITRYSQTADQLWNVKPIQYENLKLGCQRILYGMMKKVVVADRLNPFIQDVFEDYTKYGGGYIALAAVAYTIQLYMDFSGAMDCAIGTAQIIGIKLPENFNSPFFSKTISEFWTRWHISLGAWFKDFIFYPVTMSKKMKTLTVSARKKLGNHFGPLVAGAVALFCVWFCNGLWHGSAWNYILFGMYHFALILTGNIIAPYSQKFKARLHITKESVPFAMFQRVRTIVLVIIGELFFRATGSFTGVHMLKKAITDLGSFTGSFNKPSVDGKDIAIVAVTLCIVLTMSILREKGVDVRAEIAKKPKAVRWAIWYALILFILVFGAYGVNYIPVDPMYANF